jgi:hypothetical protein
MLNILSQRYQKEIALSFLSLFFISGLGSLKAQVSLNSYAAPAVYSSHRSNKITTDTTDNFSVDNLKNLNKKTIKEPVEKPKVKKDKPLSVNLKDVVTSENDNQIIKKIRLDQGSFSKKPSIGGPGQPEMSAFKSVGTDNMADPFSGDFSYNIPLLDIGGYPVNMFYNSGITMDQEASWLGLGWNINPGTVMRNMRGIPDDFDGTDKIIKQQSIRPDKTWGVSAGAGLKVIGFPNGSLSLNVNTGLSFNNKLGVALEAGIHPSLSISRNAGDGKTAALSFGANLNVNSRSGAALTPSVGVSLTDNISQTESRTGSIGLSYTQTSRAGVTGLHLDASLSKSKDLGTRSGSGAYKYNTASGTEAALSSSISFAYPTVVPSIKSIFTRRSYNLSFSLGGEIYGVNAHPRIAGYYMENKIADADKRTEHPAYGMLNYQKANNKPDAMLDFNRANDGVYTPTSPAIAMPVYTYDVFSINGEGTGGSFRATRKDLGYMRDGYTKTREDAASLGLDLGFGNTIHGGAEFSYAFTPAEAGGWNVNNLAKNVFQFQDNNGQYQSVYFKNPGEKTIPDAAFQETIGGESLVRLKLASAGSGTPMLLPKLIKYDASKNVIGEKELTPASVKNLIRDKRTQVINFLTAEEAGRIGFDKKIYSYDPDTAKIIFGAACDKTGITLIERYVQNQQEAADRKAHHISEIDVLGTDGRKYIYGIPVYNTKQVDVSFNTENGSNVTGKSNYLPGTDDTKDNTKGRDWFMNQEEMPAYTHSFLLSALVSPNYVDVTGDGITEDDMGDAVKFNYSKFNELYKWRTPVENGKASYSEGLKTDNKDDKAHYIYGEREMWYLYSVESKNMVARFYVKNDRLDAKQVTGQDGGIDGSKGMQRLYKISLFSKGDLMKLGDKAKPIKTVRFFQSYKLCKNIDNSIGGVGQNGKLTLDSIWISYNGNQKKPKSKYVFYYPVDKNPDYSYNGNDKWGNYKPTDNALNNNPVGLSNADYPYSVQDKTKADTYAASWVMNKILLPSGGVINVDFESDDYAYVQDRKAANMFRILGFGSKNNPSSTEQTNKYLFSPRGGVEYDHIYIQLTYPITATNVNEQQRELAARYFENTNQLYMKLAVNMPPKPGLPGFEFIPVYADINKFGIVPGTGGTVAFVQVNRLEGGSTPMVQQALQFIKQQLPGKAYPGYDVKDESSAKAVVLALAGMITSVSSLKMGEDAVLKQSNICREVETAKSFARLTNPLLTKYGGGLRVKRVTISDNWNKMTNQYAATYGHEYKYSTNELINGKLTTISSGVASWEPSMGSDENPHKEIMRYMNHNRGGPYDFGAIEMPLGEMFYPSPMVGYSRVEVLSIHRDTVKNLPTRQVTEFFTTKDFPFKSTSTQLTDPEANVKYEPSAIKQLLKLDMKKAITQSQGFLVDMNDMNGKIRIQATYAALDSVNAVSYTENFYNVKRATDKTYKFNHTFPTINKPDGVVDNNSLIGRDIELMADFREHKTETITTNISINFDFFFLGIFPIPLTNLLQPVVREGTTYRSASLLKIVNHYGMLDSVVVIDKGSMVSTKNLLYDAETGNPLLTRTNNEHNKPVYNFSYPAHWAYSGMGSAYKNIDANYKGLTFRNGIFEKPSPNFDMSIFESGDEMYVIAENNRGPVKAIPCDGSLPGFLPKNKENKIWAVNTAKVGSATPQMVFMDKSGNPYTATNVTLRIVRSGHRNMLDQTVGSITSLKSPVNSTTGQLEFTDATNIIQTSAATFKDHWRVDNSFYAVDSLVTVQTPLQVKVLSFSPTENLSLFDSHCDKNSSHQFNPYLNQPYFNTEYYSFGRKNGNTKTMRYGQSWAMFNFNTLPADANILKASLVLNAHTDPKIVNGYFHFQPLACGGFDVRHDQANPHNDVTRNIFYISRAKKNWSSSFNNNQWYDFYYNSGYIDQTNLVGHSPTFTSSTSYLCNNNNDTRPDITQMVRKMFAEKNTYPTGIKLSHKISISSSFSDWERNIDGPAICFQKPIIDIYYTSCTPVVQSIANPPVPNYAITCNVSFPQQYCTTTEHRIFCLSKFTKKAINPYVEGILGNWRVDTAFVYYGDRKESDPITTADTRTAGTIINFKKFWNFTNPYLARNYAASDVWVWNSTITQYNRKGYEIENKDPLGRFNAGLYGYNQQLPIAVANNARVRELMFDGFEDYDYQTALNCITCKPRRHANFNGLVPYIDATQKHTGRYSLRVDGNKNIELNAPVTDLATADRGYGLRVKVDSTSYTVTTVAPLGNGLRGKYLKFPQRKRNSLMYDEANIAIGNINNNPNTVTRTDALVSLKQNGPGLSPPSNIGWGNFVAKWEGFLLPRISGLHYFKIVFNDGMRVFINGILISGWDAKRGSTADGSTYLTVGQSYAIIVEYWDGWAGDQAVLLWKEPQSNSYEFVPTAYLYTPDKLSVAQGAVTTTINWCTKLDSVQVKGNALTDTFSLMQGKKMVFSAWVKEGGNDCKCSTYVNNGVVISYNGSGQYETLLPTGNIIEGWQRYESVFIVPQTATAVKVTLKNYRAAGQPSVFFDDVRIHPFNANVKSFVYHSSSLRLMSELDENNYASFYEYDDDGTLTRVKKETVNGVKTITETRSAMQKTIQQ